MHGWLAGRIESLRQEWTEPAPEWFPVWNGYQELQSERPWVLVPMGGAFRGEIPISSKHGWLAAHSIALESIQGEIYLHLWREMEGVQHEYEAEAMNAASKSGSKPR